MRSLFFAHARKLAISFLAVTLVFSMVPAAAMAEDTVPGPDGTALLDEIDAPNNNQGGLPDSENAQVIGNDIVEVDDPAPQDETGGTTEETTEPTVEDDEVGNEETDVPDNDTPDDSLSDTFEGSYSDDYSFEEARTILFNMQYKYSSTGGLAGIDAFSPVAVKVLVPQPQKDGLYKCEFSLKSKSKESEGFRMTLNAEPLNKYLVNPPKGDETQEELHAMLQNGDFAGDVKNKRIYAYQETNIDADPDYSVMNDTYGNRYSTEYNEAWNAARSAHIAENAKVINPKEDNEEPLCFAEIMSSSSNNHVGANALTDPKLVVTLTEAQLENAVENGLSITVNYRRNATWYTVNHWVPAKLSGLTPTEITSKPDEQKKTKDGVDYVLRDSELMQGRVGALTRAAAKTDGIYETLVSEDFSQKLIEASGTIVDVNYKAANFYRVIFDTDYAYIPRQNVEFNGSVDFSLVEDPVRKGYTFVGWQYLKHGAKKNADGNYSADDYVSIDDELTESPAIIDDTGASTPSLQLTPEFIAKVKIVTTNNVKTLSLYPKWESDTTQVTVILWTENLTGYDAQAKAKGGNTAYYDKKYTEYQNEIAPVRPIRGGGNAEFYSNVGSFTVDVPTDSSLLGSADTTLTDQIQRLVDSTFANSVKDSKGDSANKYYTQDSFEIMHATDGKLDESPTTANADGETAIYVYFTRNIYTLQFQYYGINKRGNTVIANNTNGFSFAKRDDVTGAFPEAMFDENGLFSYDYTDAGTDNKDSRPDEGNTYVTVANPDNMPCPQTITIRAKYGADLREVWPNATESETLMSTEHDSFQTVSWGTTAGGYNTDARNSTDPEPTLMGLYATMDAGIIADPTKPDNMHQLAMYWYNSDKLSHYRYNHCFELPKFDLAGVEGVKEINLFDGRLQCEYYKKHPGEIPNPDALQNKLYLVPVGTHDIAKYDFADMMKVSYNKSDNTVNYDIPGDYYAVRGYTVGGTVKYYAVGRQVETQSSNDILAQNPSARAHMRRVNDSNVADHTTQHSDKCGCTWNGNDTVGFVVDEDGHKKKEAYDLFFYYDRENYTIKYMSSSQRKDSTTNDVELGHIELPYGAHVTDAYAFELDMHDYNNNLKYQWIWPKSADNSLLPPVRVCPDRALDGNAPWVFKGWGLGPAGVNMQWTMPEKDAAVPQAQEAADFYISSDLLLYAIWEAPMLTVTFYLNGGTLADRTVDTGDRIVETIPANMKITDTSAAIPRPVKNEHNFLGWHVGTIDSDGNPIISGNEFEFDRPIIEDMHVFAMWESIADKRFNYTAYHVTPALAADDTAPHETIQLDDHGKVVPNDGTTYYVLEKDVKTDQVYTDGMIVNITAMVQPGYVPRITNKAFMPVMGDSNNVVFIYDAHAPSSFAMNFIEAGTEKTESPSLIKVVTVEADQAVMTPDKATAKELVAAGYKLVNRNDDGSYEPVSDSHNLKWIDENGEVCDIYDMNKRVIEDDAPRSVMYLVQPIPYVITYQNAKGSSLEADMALAGVTSDVSTPVETAVAAGKNPTQYTVKDRFTLKNPDRVKAADGKWYAFSYWTLGDGTTTRTELRTDGEAIYTAPQVNPFDLTKLHPLMNTKKMHPLMNKATYTTLRINPGTIGDLTFIANWVEVPENVLVVPPNDPEVPADPIIASDSPDSKIPSDPVRPSEPTPPNDPIAPKEQTSFQPSRHSRVSSLAQTGDDHNLVPCLMLVTLSGLVVIVLSIRRLRED